MDPIFRILEPESAASPPTHYSHSTLTQIESCPRQWWLLQSRYEGFEGSYPQAVSPSALLGSIVHATLEQFSIELARAMGGDKLRTVKEFRKQFPLRNTVHAKRSQLLGEVKSNPRAQATTLESSVSVDSCISLFKDLVRLSYDKAGVENLVQTPVDSVMVDEKRVAREQPGRKGLTKLKVLCPGILAEVDLRLDDPRLRGKIDLVMTAVGGDTLVEYKTGEPRPEHEDQSRLYALLWWMATGRLARERQVLYPNRDVVKFGEMGRTELEAERELVRNRIVSADREIGTPLPIVRVDSERCRFCSVRQLCREYWSAKETVGGRWTPNELASGKPEPNGGTRRDIEVELHQAEQVPEGFVVRVQAGTAAKRVVCKIPTQYRPPSIGPYKRVRLLNVGLMADGESVRILWSGSSEAFWGKRKGRDGEAPTQ